MDHLSFQLPTSFVNEFKDVKPIWGFDIGAGNSLSELTYITKYSMKKADGSKERWYETCERVINGTYSILKDHAKMNGTYWNENKALHSAKEAYALMFEFKWTPPGRGLQNMGKEMVNLDRNSAPLLNCSFISTEKLSPFSAYLATRPFVLLMEQSMNGIGVGFDTRGAGKLTIFTPKEETTTFVIEDNRESWAESVGHLLESYFLPHKKTVEFDYSLVRPAGSALGRFGGTASGPEPLRRLHEKIRYLLDGREGDKITSTDIVDICNLIGKAVVSGGARRSAEIALGFADDKEFLNLKNWEINPERNGADGWAHLSNNSVVFESGNYGLENILDRVADNGEPGIINLHLARSYGRLKDGFDDSDSEVLGVNPCFSGDTLIAMADGRGAVPIKELAEIGEDVMVYSVNPECGVEVKWARNPRMTRRSAETVEVVLDDDSIITVTPDHKMRLLDGSVVHASDLKVGDRLPRFTKRAETMARNGQKYLRVSCDTLDQNRNKVMEHRLVARFLWNDKFNEIEEEGKSDGWMKGGAVVHHRDFHGLNNSPENLEVMSFSDHQELHARLCNMSGSANPMYGKTHSNSTKDLISRKARERWQSEDYKEMMSKTFTDERRNAVSEAWRATKKKEWLNWYIEQEQKTDLPTVWIDDALCAVKTCQECKTEFVVRWSLRDSSFCGKNCQMLYLGRLEKRKDAVKTSLIDRQKQTLFDQIRIYGDLKSELGRTPYKTEWEQRCSKENVSKRTRPKYDGENPYILRGFKELSDLAAMSNHRVKEVRSGIVQDVYNLTVEDNHTVGIVTKFNEENMSCDGVFAFQCAEVTLNSYEVCNLSEVHMPHIANIEEFKRVMKFAYLYSKAVTLLPTPWAEVNDVVVRNRRIGTSVSGVTQFLEGRDWSVLTEWLDLGYAEIISWDKKYSSWLGVRESIKHTSVKPSGTVSIISGITPGVHWPVASGNYVRRQRFAVSDPMVPIFADAGYTIEPDVMDPDFTVVVEFPTAGPVMRDQTNVSLWEKAALAALLARYWADNAVSVTLTFDPDSETSQVGPVIKAYFDQLKTMSFLKIDNNVYPQMPYESVDSEKFDTMRSVVKPIDWSLVYDGELGSHAQGDKFCDGDTCLVPIG